VVATAGTRRTWWPCLTDKVMDALLGHVHEPSPLGSRWHLADDHVANLERLTTGPRTGEILALPVEVPGAGRPLQRARQRRDLPLRRTAVLSLRRPASVEAHGQLSALSVATMLAHALAT
jgi:hypothetical protein